MGELVAGGVSMNGSAKGSLMGTSMVLIAFGMQMVLSATATMNYNMLFMGIIIIFLGISLIFIREAMKGIVAQDMGEIAMKHGLSRREVAEIAEEILIPIIQEKAQELVKDEL